MSGLSPAANPASSIPSALGPEITLIKEQFPRIANKIVQLWGMAELDRYLESLVFDERGGRQGFPEEIGSALFKIRDSHGKMISSGNNGDIWDVILGQVEK